MKVCCSSGKVYEDLTDYERIGGCSTDHCKGPINLEYFLLYAHGKLDTTECISADHLSTLIPNKVIEENT